MAPERDARPLTAVAKVGGSLFDLPDLGPRLRRWLSERDDHHFILIPGGGAIADVIRHLDRQHHLGERVAHWLALRSLSLNAHVLAALLRDLPVIDYLPRPEEWEAEGWPVVILDPAAFVWADRRSPERLPESWDVTSDSVAARVAQAFSADRLILLKSADLEAPYDWNRAAKRGFVDPYFATIVANAGVEVEVVNLRATCP